jgi:hypothetical protein
MRSAPRLSVAAEPERIAVADDDGEPRRMSPVQFRMYTNYSYFIERAEVRIFENGQSVETEPLDVIEISEDDAVAWQAQPDWFEGPVHELAYVLRAYGSDGNFDETNPQPLWAVYGDVEAPVEDDEDDEFEWSPELFTAYGENSLTMHNIGLSSGTVSVRGSVAPGEQDVWVAGRPVPVDEQGNFAHG